MNLNTYLANHGRAAALSRQTGFSPIMISLYRARRRGVPPAKCPIIERLSGAQVTCEELRPDLPWARLPDPSWPHPQGRPVLDYSRP